jgi:hypothetical protein
VLAAGYAPVFGGPSVAPLGNNQIGRMTTVQLAITNRNYASALGKLLSAEGHFSVVIVDQPDSSIPGLIVLTDNLVSAVQSSDPERFVIISTDREIQHQNRLWKAGFRHVIFADQSLEMACLAIVAAHLRLQSRVPQPNCSILDGEGVSGLHENGLQGPFALTDSVIDDVVLLQSPGAFVLDSSEDGPSFRAVFVGRSDLDVNNQLHVYVGTYKRFKFIYCPTAQRAFERECSLFHDFEPTDNVHHPLRPRGSNWNCPRCKLLG